MLELKTIHLMVKRHSRIRTIAEEELPPPPRPATDHPTTLVLGGPGAGKTLFAMQTLAEGARLSVGEMNGDFDYAPAAALHEQLERLLGLAEIARNAQAGDG